MMILKTCEASRNLVQRFGACRRPPSMRAHAHIYTCRSPSNSLPLIASSPPSQIFFFVVIKINTGNFFSLYYSHLVPWHKLLWIFFRILYWRYLPTLYILWIAYPKWSLSHCHFPMKWASLGCVMSSGESQYFVVFFVQSPTYNKEACVQSTI